MEVYEMLYSVTNGKLISINSIVTFCLIQAASDGRKIISKE